MMLQEPRLLDVNQFAAKLQISRTTVFQWLKGGVLKPGRHYMRIGRVLRFYWSDEAVHKFMEDTVNSSTSKGQDYTNCFSQPQTIRTRKKGSINWDYGK